MIKFFFLAFLQIFNPQFRKIIWLSVVSSLVIFLFIWSVVGYFILQVDLLSTAWSFGFLDGITNEFFRFFGGAIVLTLTWLLFPSVVSLILVFFLEKAALIVEKKYYPQHSKYRPQNLIEILSITIKYSGLAILINLLALPIYIGLFFFGPLNLIVFFIINGYLLGREYFELIIHRHHSPKIAKKISINSRNRLFFAGCIITFLMTVPLINLIAPLIATSAMVHIVQKLYVENPELLV